MSEGNGKVTPEGPAVALQLVITVYEGGQVRVDGPIDTQPVPCLGLLEVAKQSIFEFQKEAQKQVQLAPAGLAGLFKRKKE